MSDETKYWIYAGGLPYQLSEGDIICVFSQYGEIHEINLSRDKETQKSRGFCFLKYEDTRSCELAVDNLHEAVIVGRKIKVSFANNLTAIKAGNPVNVAPMVGDNLSKGSAAPLLPLLPPPKREISDEKSDNNHYRSDDRSKDYEKDSRHRHERKRERSDDREHRHGRHRRDSSGSRESRESRDSIRNRKHSRRHRDRSERDSRSRRDRSRSGDRKRKSSRERRHDRHHHHRDRNRDKERDHKSRDSDGHRDTHEVRSRRR